MADFFASGHAADLILGVLLIEAAWLGLRAALVGADWWMVALPLAASLPLHLMDLRKRLAAHPSD
jgi:hypothetical protein